MILTEPSWIRGRILHVRQTICSRSWGGAQLSAEAVARFVGKGLRHLIQNCLETKDSKQIEKGSKIYREYYAKHMLDHSTLYPGVRELLDHFGARKQAVVTNKPDPFSTDILKALGVLDYFSDVIAGNSNFPRKPDPTAIVSLMRREDIPAKEVIMIGDSPIDVETGRNAEIETAVLSHGFVSRNELESSRPNALFADFYQLLEYAKRNGW